MHNSTVDKPTELEVWQHIGAHVLAPLLGCFAWWLHRRAIRDGITQLLFLARDGYMLQQAYRRVIPVEQQLPHHYMYASRRLFNVAGIHRLDEANLTFLVGDQAGMPVRHYLKRIGLEARRYESQMVQAGFSGPDAIADDLTQVRQLLLSLEQPILKNAARERSRLVAYASELVDWDRGRIGIVDAGWHGSLQASLVQALGVSPNRIWGYYLGLHRQAHRRTGHTMAAFLEEASWRDRMMYQLTIRQSVEIFETFLIGREGSIIGLRRAASSASIVPVHAPSEVPAALGRRLTVMQHQALTVLAEGSGSPRRWLVLWRLIGLMCWPTSAQARALGEIPHQESFGGLGQAVPLASPRWTGRTYARHPLTLIQDLRNAYWRPGFMKRLWS